MYSTGNLSFFTLVLMVILCARAFGQDLTLTVQGQVKHPLTFSKKDFKALPRTRVVATDPQGVKNLYEGVPLFELLLKAGAPSGDSLHGKNLTLYVQAEALDAKESPLQIIVPGEKKHARWVRQLKTLRVLRSME